MRVILAALALLATRPAPQEKYRVEEGQGALARTLHLDRAALALAASPDGKLLAIGVRGKVLLAGFEDGKLLQSVDTGRGSVRGLAFSPDGKQLAAGAIGGIFLIEVATGKVVWKAPGHPSPQKGGDGAYGVAFTTDGTEILSVSPDDSNLRSWSSRDGSAGKSVDAKSPLNRIAVSGERIAVASEEGIAVYGTGLAEAWRQKARLAGAIAFSPDGTLLAAGVTGSEASVTLREAATGKAAGRVDLAGAGSLTGLAWTPDGKRLVTGTSRGGKVLLWSRGKESEGPSATLDPAFKVSSDIDRAAVAGLAGKAVVVAVAGTESQVRIYKIPE